MTGCGFSVDAHVVAAAAGSCADGDRRRVSDWLNGRLRRSVCASLTAVGDVRYVSGCWSDLLDCHDDCSPGGRLTSAVDCASANVGVL